MTKNFAGNHATAPLATAAPHHATDHLYSDRDAAELLGCGRSTLWRWAAEGIIPKPLKIGGMSRWKLSDLQAVIAKAEAQREAA
ncbi:helix-turn-helix transcriptional regulator [Citreimonas salinaria]|uniref:Transcriptional regulator, AlpA family n=1 Tax=Citreimonas salinaria TaxID=321339 RepID=A0A1H3MHR8_9RHOB|nr:helix-turn-helix domain-containing protein [Citreimonas salinaria]SDY75605.1 transcriptional regulator, AlpA family [Citreimonas salinaria]